jgi:hypothetical protein
MSRIVRLTESDLTRIVKRVIKESFEIPGFQLIKQITNNEGDKLDILGKNFGDYQVIIYTAIKNVNGEDKRVISVYTGLPNGKKVDINKNAGGKSWVVIKDVDDAKLSQLIKAAQNFGIDFKFQADWENAPSLKSRGSML